MIARSAKKFWSFVSKTGVATATAVQYLMGSCLPHQHYTDWYDGRHISCYTSFFHHVVDAKFKNPKREGHLYTERWSPLHRPQVWSNFPPRIWRRLESPHSLTWCTAKRQVHGISSPVSSCYQNQLKFTPLFFSIRSYTIPIPTLIDCKPSAIRQVVGLLSIHPISTHIFLSNYKPSAIRQVVGMQIHPPNQHPASLSKRHVSCSSS